MLFTLSKTRWKTVCLALFLAYQIYPSNTFAQIERMGQGSNEELVSFEPHFFSTDSNTVHLDILYRIRYDFFIFTYHPESPDLFTGSGDLSVELLDSSQTSVVRQINTIELKTDHASTQALREKYCQGSVSFILRPGRYTAIYHLEDAESQREYSRSNQPIIIPTFTSKNTVRSSLMFVETVDSVNSTTEFTPYNIGGGITFGKNTGVIMTVSGTTLSDSLHYSLSRLAGEEKALTPVQKDTTITLSYVKGMKPSLIVKDSSSIGYKLIPDTTVSLAYFTLPAKQLEQGHYLAIFHFAAGDTSEIRKDFAVQWINMPFALTDLDFAISAMKYITTDSEYDNLQSGSKSERIKKFHDFWKQRDPTPTTAYNEMMAEYFERVDYAYSEFRTLKEQNGVLTDRGRIYILYGKPSFIGRTMEPGEAPKEIWTYSSLKKEFIFADPDHNGTYRLTSIGDL
jgi:GWxTD domain-containing protein